MTRSQPFSLSGMVDTDREDETVNADALPTPDSNQENAGGTKKKAPRQKASAKRFTKPKRLSGGSTTTKSEVAPKSKPGRKRPQVKEQPQQHDANETEEVDEFAAEEPEKGEAKPKVTTKRKATDQKAGRPAKALTVNHVGAAKTDGEFEYTPTAIRRRKKPESKPVPRKPTEVDREPSLEPQHDREIPETQPFVETDPSTLPDEHDLEDDVLPQSIVRRRDNGRQTSRQRKPFLGKSQAGGTSDTERTGGEPALRRRLGEITRKFETIDSRYRTLRETRSTEAEAIYERLKKQSEANAKAANDLIVSLKKEIATQKAITQESQSMRNQLSTRDADLAKTQALANQLSTSLAEIQNENKALQAKLANSRNASVAVESLGAKTPASAMKVKSQAQSRTLMVGSAEAAHAAQVAQLKEDLYSDLTGLILRGVDIGVEADTYDCIQTGRNGTLHFKLAIAKESDDSYENTEFQYTPRLDENRDRDLIALLPEYLTDEITFSRTNAAMFYGRVLETLTKRRPIDEGE